MKSCLRTELHNNEKTQLILIKCNLELNNMIKKKIISFNKKQFRFI